MCDIIKNFTDKPKEIYKVEGPFGNVLLTAARNNRHEGVLSTLCEHLNSVLTKDEIKSMFQLKDRHGQNIIEIATDSDTVELIPLLPNYLTSNEIKSLLRSVDDRNQKFLQRALTRNASKRLNLKFDVVKTNFNLEDQKIFFYRPANAQNIFHCAAQNKNEKIFETIIESTRDVFSNDEIKSILMEKDSNRSNVLHNIAQRDDGYKLNKLNLLLRERLSDE